MFGWLNVHTCVFFFFQAEDGIRDYKVTGVQTCALPIYRVLAPSLARNPFVSFGRHSKRRMRPLLFATRSRGQQPVCGPTDGSHRDYEIADKFHKLPVCEAVPFLCNVRSEPGTSDD